MSEQLHQPQSYAEMLSDPVAMRDRRMEQTGQDGDQAGIIDSTSVHPNLLSDDEAQRSRNDLAVIEAGEIPDSLQLKRDWSLPRKEYDKAQADAVGEGKNNITARLAAHERAAEAETWKKGVKEYNELLAKREEVVRRELQNAHLIGLRTTPKLRQEAEAKADELFPLPNGRSAEITHTGRREEAERRQSLYAKQLKAHDRAVVRAAAAPGEYRLTGDQLVDQGTEKIGDVPLSFRRGNENKYGYAGPVKNGMEIEPRKSSEAVPYKEGEVAAKDITSERLERLIERLDEVRADYIEITAGRRGISSFSRKYSTERLEQVQKAYEDLRDAAGAEGAKLLREAGYTDDNLKSLSQMGAIEESLTLERGLSARRQELSEGKKLHKFYDWWARQSGLKGTAKKMAVMGLVGLPIGLAAGAAGTFALGPIGGGAIAAALARGVTRGIASAKIAKEAGALTQAQEDSATAYGRHKERIGRASQASETLSTRHLTEVAASDTEATVRRNRRRLLGAAAIGAAAGLAGSFAGAAIAGVHHQPGGIHHVPQHPKPAPTTPPATEAPAPSPNVDLNQYTWDVAHEVTPGNEIPTMQSAIDQFNAIHGTQFALTPNEGTTMIMNGSQVINPAQMAELNGYIVNG